MRERVRVSGELWLRRWSPRDAEAVRAAFGDPLMTRQSREPVGSMEAARAWIAAREEEWATGSGYAFAVADAADLALGNAAVGALDPRHRTGWVSYWTVPGARGRGLASQACRALARWAFTDAGLFRLELGHRLDNPASCAVARAAGFRAEGLERAKLEYDGRRYDVERHARLATDPDPDPGPP